MIPKKLLLLLSFTFCLYSANCQQEPTKHRLSNTQKRLLKSLIKYNRVDGQRIGRASIYSEQYIRFDSLRRISSKADILLFTKSRSAVIKVYAFNSLIDTKDVSNALQVLTTNYKDTTVFRHLFGCIGGASTLGKYMFVKFNSSAKRKVISLTFKQQAILDTIRKKIPDYDTEKQIVSHQMNADE